MSLDFLKGILVRDDESAYDALLQLKVNGVDIQGSGLEKQLERILGRNNIGNIDTALGVLNERINKKVANVEGKIDSLSESITLDPQRQEVVKKELEKIVQGELATEKENIDSVAKAAFGDEVDSEKEMAAKKAVEEAKQIVLKNPKDVRVYREKKAGEESDLETSGRKLSDKEKELLRNGSFEGKLSAKEEELLQKGLYNQKKKLAEKVASKAGIENQEQNIMDNYKDQSLAEKERNYHLIGMGIAFKRMSPAERKAVLKKNTAIDSALGRFKSNIPSNEISKKVLALDNIATHLSRNKRSLGYLGSSQGGGSFLVRFKMTFFNLGNVLMGRRTTEGSDGFLSTIGGQSIDTFLPNSMRLLSRNGESGLEGMFAAMAGQKLKSLAGDAALKLAGGALGPAGLAATKVLGFLKKFFGDAGSKLGLGLKAGAGKAFDKAGSGLGKLAMGLGALLASTGIIGTAIASTTISGAVVGGIAAPFLYQQYVLTGEMISALPVAKKSCESRMEWVQNEKKPPIPCGDMEEYNKILRQQITDVGYQTRCAVVAAAQYLALDFPYHISYKWGGYYYGDGLSKNWCSGGMDCNSFIVWAFRQGGFAMTKSGRSETWQGVGAGFETEKIPFSEANCARIKEIAKPGDLIKTPGVHAALVIGFDGTKLAIAQEGGNGSGLNVCYLNPCTGSGRGLEHRCGKFKEYWSMDNFFEHYVEGTSINDFKIRPNSKIRSLTGDILEDVNKLD